MKAIERKITASRDGKILYLRINNQKITIPWRDSRYYRGERVLVSVSKMKDTTVYSVCPRDGRLPWDETHWKLVENGISSETNG